MIQYLFSNFLAIVYKAMHCKAEIVTSTHVRPNKSFLSSNARTERVTMLQRCF